MNNLLTIAFIALLCAVAQGQCTNIGSGYDQGTLSFDGNTSSYQTTTVYDGYYYEFTASCGNSFSFDFCGNGGSTSSLYSQITILDNANNPVAFGPYTGGCATLNWTALTAGTYYVFITDDYNGGCSSTDSYSGTMAYNVDNSPLNTNFVLTAAGCSSINSTINGTTGGVFSFNPNPGDGASINSSTGTITNAIQGTQYFVEYSVCSSSTIESIVMPNPDATFTMIEVCGGGVVTDEIIPGGTYAFNPNPGDGSQISSTTGAVTNGTVGSTYTVEYTVCGASQSQNLTVTDNNCFTMNGNAQTLMVEGEECIQLTEEINDENGCAWSNTTINFTENFSLSLDYYFGSNINGADGNTFTFQPSSSAACGQDGGQLGAGGISNALSIEFDTYDNDNPSHIYDRLCDHVAIEVDGDHMNGTPAAGPECAKANGDNIDDGGVYEVEITWDAASQTLKVFFDGVQRLTYTEDVINNVFGGASDVYWGATAATGGLNNEQYFCPSTITILPTELASFVSTCENEQEIIHWSTASEREVDYFQVEATFDGAIFFPLGQVTAVGNSTQLQNYSFQVPECNHPYYRLKMVNFNGSFENSGLIMRSKCTGEDQLSAIQKDKNIIVESSEMGTCQLIDTKGKIVIDTEQTSKQFNLDINQIESGIYIVMFQNKLGNVTTKKLFLN